MGVRTLLSMVRNLVTGKSFEVWEGADGELSATLGGRPIVVAETSPAGGLEALTLGDADILIISDLPPNDADGRLIGTIYFQIQG